jgi:hypothetical protein
VSAGPLLLGAGEHAEAIGKRAQMQAGVQQALNQGGELSAEQPGRGCANLQLEMYALRTTAYARCVAAAKKAVAAHVLGRSGGDHSDGVHQCTQLSAQLCSHKGKCLCRARCRSLQQPSDKMPGQHVCT